MKRFTRLTIIAPLLAIMLLSACHNKTEASRENFTATIESYLSERGHLCLAKYDWPIYVADQDVQSRDAAQMPVMEKLGLVKSTPMMLEHPDDKGGKITAPGRKYELTEAGQKYYLHKPVVIATGGKTLTHEADFCVAALTLDKIVGWEPPQTRNGETRTAILFTYKIEPVPFAKDAEFQRVFPMVARVIEGAGTSQLREGVRLTKDGWVAEELFQR
ncbi:MAG: hypothetical protein LBG66_03520 [Gallionellaceae bacterium]|jgi:hypothetical protein|nr:hypothetical protein [Gallionellaceae bacterium]